MCDKSSFPLGRSVENLTFCVKQYLAPVCHGYAYGSSTNRAYCMAILPGSRSDFDEKEALD